MTTMVKKNSVGTQLEKWLYTWNPRDQLTKVEKRTGTGDGTYAGKVEYAYCLSCDGALAHRKEYDPVTSTTITSWKRYEYDGLKLLRVDEKYDSNSNGIDTNDPWRTVEASTYGPGIVGNLLAKRVYTHTNNDATPDATNDYYYGYDHVGNVYIIFNADGEEAYHFNQDAFGNELNFEGYAGDSWATAAAAGISEHQTGKWIDPFSGLYFFNARWYSSEVGRFVSRSKRPVSREHPYVFVNNSPNDFADVNGKDAIDIPDGPDIPPGKGGIPGFFCHLKCRIRAWLEGGDFWGPAARLCIETTCKDPIIPIPEPEPITIEDCNPPGSPSPPPGWIIPPPGSLFPIFIMPHILCPDFLKCPTGGGGYT